MRKPAATLLKSAGFLAGLILLYLSKRATEKSLSVTATIATVCTPVALKLGLTS